MTEPPASPSGEVRLREVAEADLPIFFEHQRDPGAVRMAAFRSRDRPAFMAHWAKIMADSSTVLKTILFDGHVAGNVVSWEGAGEREVGYWIGREFWGRGIASRALAAFVEQLPARPLYAHVAKHNLASLRVLEKCGFAICAEEKGFASADGEQIDGFILKLR
jgi:RimJ/RimL family protein N-acetyltransferase